MDRITVRQTVRVCQACPLHKVSAGPVPLSGPAPARIALMAEAPGRMEDRAGEVLVGPSGRLLRRSLEGAGLTWSSVARLNVVSCWPQRTPSTKEIQACRYNLAIQLQVIQPSYILILGGVALSAFLPGTKITELRGEWWQIRIPGPDAEIVRDAEGDGVSYIDNGSVQPLAIMPDYTLAWTMATFHPAAILRNQELQKGWESDLATFHFHTLGMFDPSYMQYCVVDGRGTGVPAEYYKDGVGYCKRHAPKQEVEKVKRLKGGVKINKLQERLI